MNYEEALRYTKKLGSGTLRWMLENGKTREADLPKTKVKIIERKRQLLKAAGIEMETGREEGAA